MNKSDEETPERIGKTVFVVIEPPRPWPVAKAISLYKAPGLEIVALPSGRIQLSSQTYSLSRQSAPVFFRRSGAVSVMAMVGPEQVALTLWGRDILDQTRGTITVPLRNRKVVVEEDVSAIERSRSAHRRTLKAVGDIQVNADKRFATLRGELDQLSDLSSHLRAGSTYHAPGVSVLLRKLLVRGAGNQLLRDIATMTRQPLTIYTVFEPPWPEGLTRPDRHLRLYFSAFPNDLNPVRTDLEAWLDQPGYDGDGESLSHHDVIKTISDKIGAHVDLDEGAVIRFLKTLEFGGVKIIVGYLLRVSEMAIAVGERLIEGRASPGGQANGSPTTRSIVEQT